MKYIMKRGSVERIVDTEESKAHLESLGYSEVKADTEDIPEEVKVDEKDAEKIQEENEKVAPVQPEKKQARGKK